MAVGTFNLTVGGEDQDSGGDAFGDQLAAAIAAINGLVAGGNTNYEAALAQANEWITGGAVTIVAAHSFDADTDGGENNAYVLTDNHGVRIAVVSAWEPFSPPGSQVLDNVDNDSGAFGVNDDDEIDETDEALRFDFGAFNDFDGAGEFGLAGEAAGFRGNDVSSATFSFRSFGDGSSVNYEVFYVGGGSSGLINVPIADSPLENFVISGGGNLIAYIQFTVPAGQGGRIDLESAVIGTSPILDADENHVVFFSDGEPNHELQDDGDVEESDDAQDAVDAASNEIVAIETDGDAGGPEQAFILHAFGANVQNAALAIDGSDDFNGNSTGGDDIAHVLYSGGTRIAVVSGWDQNGTELVGANGSTGSGWGVDRDSPDESSSDELDNSEERLRFDFADFDDFDGAGTYEADGDAVGFNGPNITTATFVMRSFELGQQHRSIQGLLHGRHRLRRSVAQFQLRQFAFRRACDQCSWRQVHRPRGVQRSVRQRPRRSRVGRAGGGARPRDSRPSRRSRRRRGQHHEPDGAR